MPRIILIIVVTTISLVLCGVGVALPETVTVPGYSGTNPFNNMGTNSGGDVGLHLYANAPTTITGFDFYGQGISTSSPDTIELGTLSSDKKTLTVLNSMSITSSTIKATGLSWSIAGAGDYYLVLVDPDSDVHGTYKAESSSIYPVNTGPGWTIEVVHGCYMHAVFGDGNQLLDDLADYYRWYCFASITDASSAIPLPPSAFLLGSGLIGLAVARLRKSWRK